MATKKLPIIRVSTKYNSLNHNDFHARLVAVLKGTFDNSKIPEPLPVDKPTFEAGVQRYADLIGAALDGSKKIIAELDKQRTTMAMYLRLLAHHVETVSAGNMDVVVSSGFEPKSTTRSSQPLDQPTIKVVDQGTSGELLVNITPVKRARSYEIRYGIPSAPVSAWAVKAVPVAKQPVSIDGLTAATLYSFQVRAFGTLGFTDWSAAYNRMCI
jgi:hypothetical protein